MPFELTRPGGLWLLTLAVPLVALYLLKVRRQEQRVGSTWLWQKAQRDLLAQTPFRRFTCEWPLLLQLAALAGLSVALAGPSVRGRTILGDHVALVVDTSASMGALEPDGKTRFDHARAAVRRVLGGLSPGADAWLIEAGREPRITTALERDVRKLEAALNALAPRDVEGELSRSVALAADRLRALDGSKRIVLVTDGAAPDPGLVSSAELPIDVIRVGGPRDNTAIVRVDVRRGVDPVTRRDQVQAFASVLHRGAAPREVFVTLRQKDVVSPLASRKLVLKPGERAPVVLSFDPAPSDAGTGLIVELSPPDALPADDRAYGRVPASPKLPVVLTPPAASPWVERALRADPEAELIEVPLDALATEALPYDSLVVIQGACPARSPGADVLIIAPPPGPCRTLRVGSAIDQAAVTTWQEADLRLRFLTMDGVLVRTARQLIAERAQDELVRTAQGAVVADASSPGQTVTVVGFDVAESNWPLKASFVLFVRNVMELAREHRARGITGPATTGESVRLRVPVDLEELRVEDPSGASRELPVNGGLAVLPETTRAGFYFVSWQGERPGSVLLPANLTSEAESDLAPRELGTSTPASAARRGALPQALTEWTWVFALLALLLLAADVVWWTRAPSRGSALRRRPGEPGVEARG